MSNWNELQAVDELFCDLKQMDIEDSGGSFSVEMAISRIGVRSVHVLWGQNQLARQVSSWKEHFVNYPTGLVVNALMETIRVLVDEVGGYKSNDLLIMYGLHDIE